MEYPQLQLDSASDRRLAHTLSQHQSHACNTSRSSRLWKCQVAPHPLLAWLLGSHILIIFHICECGHFPPHSTELHWDFIGRSTGSQTHGQVVQQLFSNIVAGSITQYVTNSLKTTSLIRNQRSNKSSRLTLIQIGYLTAESRGWCCRYNIIRRSCQRLVSADCSESQDFPSVSFIMLSLQINQ